jgi:DNA processing protein
LHRIPGVGPVTFARLLNQFSNLQVLFENPKLAEGISERSRSALLSPDWDQVERDLAWFDAPDRHIVTLHDARYPPLLKEIADPPSLLFVQGEVSLLSQWQLAVVGSRNPSPPGRDNAFEFARFLATGGLSITSGLAMGIDTAAHQGALAGQGKTIAVVGTGLDRVYPAKNRDLAYDIVERGAIVSEFALGTSPRAENFPRRNRLISGLSLGTLVIEAAIQSGSLITARMALEQGREVFAIPGSIHNPLAKGCHRLIREGAKLVETAEDIIEELGAIAAVDSERFESSAVSNADLQLADPDYQVLLACLGYDPIEIDRLIAESGLTAEIVSSMLLLLELEGQVASLSGGRYVRVGR